MDDSFPKYNKSRLKGEIGVSTFKKAVEEELEWIFRRNYQDFDFGIDGYIDLITEYGHVTGKSIAVQIKYGKSFFKESNEIGWIFRGEKKHLNYLMNMEIPTLICLVNPDSKEIFWTLFEFEETNKAGNNWTITIPFNQRLNKNAKIKLNSYTGDVTDYISQFENYWEMNQNLEEAGLVMFVIDREDVENQNTIPFLQMFNRLEVNKRLITAMRNKVNFMVDGYDKDQRELFQIPEVRKWMKSIKSQINSWGYFLDMTNKRYNGLLIIHACTSEYKVLGKKGNTHQVFFPPEEFEKSLNQIFHGLNTFCEKHGLSQEINKEQSKLVLDCLSPSKK